MRELLRAVPFCEQCGPCVIGSSCRPSLNYPERGGPGTRDGTVLIGYERRVSSLRTLASIAARRALTRRRLLIVDLLVIGLED